MPKKLKGYRTLLFNVVTAAPVVFDIAVQSAADPTISAIIPPEYLPYYLAAVTIGNIVLRVVTTTPVGKPVKPGNTAAEPVLGIGAADQPGKPPRQPRKPGAGRA